jgi:FixJ family two-component response regulator
MVGDPPGPIAIVDDDLAVLDSLKFLLEVLGFSVRTYRSGALFLADLTTRPSRLILDQHMPGMTGLEVATSLRASGILIPILLITGARTPVILERATALGIHRVLEKPPEEDELLRFVTPDE